MNLKEKSQKIAEALNEHNHWNLIKQGWFYRPHARGYTNNPIEAGVWTLEEAKKLECSKGYPDEVKAIPAQPKNYFDDWDVIYDTEQKIPKDKIQVYINNLQEICHPKNPIFATKEEKGEAIFRTVVQKSEK